MTVLYVTEYGAKIGFRQGRFVVTKEDDEIASIPSECIEGISILGEAVFSSVAVKRCLSDGICVTYLSKGGRYFGRLVSTNHVNTFRQRQQDKLYHSDFAANLAKEIVSGKIHNQSIVLYRAAKAITDPNVCNRIFEIREQMKSMERKGLSSCSLDELRGCEGLAAKLYFEGLSLCTRDEFKFRGRSRRPPRDPFNSMLSFGYSVLFNEIYSVLEQKGLNPYFGFFHQDDEKHATLVSDMMEEWRAVIVDALVLALISKREVRLDDFEDNGDQGIAMTRDCIKTLVTQMQKKLATVSHYLKYVDYETSFSDAIALQINSLCHAIESEDASLYKAIRIS